MYTCMRVFVFVHVCVCVHIVEESRQIWNVPRHTYSRLLFCNRLFYRALLQKRPIKETMWLVTRIQTNLCV